MSRAARRREARKGGGRSAPGRRQPYWIIAVCVGAALLVVGVVAELSDTGVHPEARASEQAPHVMPAARYAGMGRAENAYQMAAAVPHVIDGLFCYCFCSQHSGHYSLLDCFAGDHGAACDICMREVEVAYQMTQQGASVADIRGEIDRLYGA